MKKFILAVLIPIISFAQMTFTQPAPTFENPRKWLIKLNTADIHVVNHTLGAIYNVLSEYPPEAIKIAVVVYGKGMRVLKKDYDKKTLSRISSLMDYDVEFVGCKNTMKTMNWTQDDFIDDISYVQAGVAEVIERQYDGWYVNTPY